MSVECTVAREGKPPARARRDDARFGSVPHGARRHTWTAAAFSRPRPRCRFVGARGFLLCGLLRDKEADAAEDPTPMLSAHCRSADAGRLRRTLPTSCYKRAWRREGEMTRRQLTDFQLARTSGIAPGNTAVAQTMRLPPTRRRRGGCAQQRPHFSIQESGQLGVAAWRARRRRGLRRCDPEPSADAAAMSAAETTPPKNVEAAKQPMPASKSAPALPNIPRKKGGGAKKTTSQKAGAGGLVFKSGREQREGAAGLFIWQDGALRQPKPAGAGGSGRAREARLWHGDVSCRQDGREGHGSRVRSAGPASSLVKLTDLIAKLDQNGDGELSREELRDGLSGVLAAASEDGADPTNEAVEQVLGAFDADGSGSINENELKKALQQHAQARRADDPACRRSGYVRCECRQQQ